tara:strand:- start:853 stop:1182 length:330 start_codon:yes stop_codon:yes gene_type:complete
MGYKEEALSILAPNKQWSILGTTLVWHSEGPYPTDEEIQAKADEIAAEEPLVELRAERNKRLAESDWIVTKSLEAGENVPSNWKTYRQALRDITKSYSSLQDVVWPSGG